jgi:hypothetical protein
MPLARVLLPLVLAAAAAVAAFASGIPFLFGVGAGVAVAAAILAFGLPIERLAFVAVAAFILTVTWNGIRVPGGALANVFMSLAVAAAVAYVVLERRTVPLPAWLFVAGTGFGLAALLVLVFPPDAELVNRMLIEQRKLAIESGVSGQLFLRSDLMTLFQYGVSLVLVPVLIATVATTYGRITRLLDMWTVSATICAAVAILDYAGFQVAPVEALGTRSAGLTIHPNYLALTAAMAIPTAFLWVNRRGRWQSAGLLAVAILLGGVFASGSRAGTVGALLAVVASVALLPRLRRALGVVVPVAGMMLIGLLMFTNTGSEILEQVRLGGDDITTSGSNVQRERLFDLAVDQFAAHPVQGVGMAVIQDAHSIYVQLLAAGGVIALASFFVFLGGLAGAARRALSGSGRELAIATSISIVVWLANGVFDNQLADKYLYVLPGLLIATSYVAAAELAREPAARAARAARAEAPPFAGAPTGSPA